LLLDHWCYHRRSSSRDWLLVQSSRPAEVLPLLVRHSHFAAGLFLGCVVFLQRASAGHCSASSRTLSSSFASLQSITQQNLASQPQPANSSHGLLFPSAHEESKVHLTRASQPATFRLQGLATLLTAYSLRSRAGFVSHRQRSWDSPFGGSPSRKVSGVLPPETTHIPFSLAVFPPPKRRAGPIGLGSWASTLPRVPAGRMRV
jgi:hypothetical protein